MVEVTPFKRQLLKWVGSKARVAHRIIAHFPDGFATYHEPFLGSGAVLAALRPERACASDLFAPLIEIFTALSRDPEVVKVWYGERLAHFQSGPALERYADIRARYNAAPNGADFLFLSRACYGGVVRFRRKDGAMSTPLGAHPLMPLARFSDRVDLWAVRIRGTTFATCDYREAMARAAPGDLVYCDPPYATSQSILYGAQAFQLPELFGAIAECKARGVRVALSIDGAKKSGRRDCAPDVPAGLFERVVTLDLGGSMLRRFQMEGGQMDGEEVSDRLMLSW